VPDDITVKCQWYALVYLRCTLGFSLDTKSKNMVQSGISLDTTKAGFGSNLGQNHCSGFAPAKSLSPLALQVSTNPQTDLAQQAGGVSGGCARWACQVGVPGGRARWVYVGQVMEVAIPSCYNRYGL